MENAAKALEIAAGVLLAVLIISFIVYFFSTISEWPQQEDAMQTSEQLAQFNLEYEVYEKNAMYGVDVISCLNKAQSNNEKYVEGSAGFLAGNTYGRDFTINVYVKINSPLQERMEIYYFDESLNKEVQRMSDSTTEFIALSSPKTLSIIGIKELNTSRYYTDFNKDTDKLYSQTKVLDDAVKYVVPSGGSHRLTLADGTEKYYYSIMDSQLRKLLEISSNDLKITKKNNNPNTYRYWSTAIWETALYNFKTKRFSCDSINYNEKTGRVNELYFSEL